MIIADQIRAARGLLGWSQSELSKQTGLSTPAIGNIEIEKHKPTLETQTKIIRAFEEAGVEFIDEGVRRKKDKITVFEGEDAFLKLLDDIYYTVLDHPYKNILVMCADEKKSPAEVIEKVRLIRRNGGKFKFLIEDQETYIMGPLNEYRYLPAKYFINQVTFIYGNKTAFITDTPQLIITVIKDDQLQKSQKNFFEFMWSNLKAPTWSSAEEKYE